MLSVVPKSADPETIEALEDILELARSGEVLDLVVVANLTGDRCFVRLADFADSWRALGALEYAKSAVIGGMNGH